LSLTQIWAKKTVFVQTLLINPGKEGDIMNTQRNDRMEDKPRNLSCIAGTLLVSCLILLISFSVSYAGIVNVGAGSYTDSLPEGKKGPQATIYKTAAYPGPMQTNDWWSSVAWNPYSDAMYPHPFSMKFVGTGLEVDYPTKVVYPQSYGETDIAYDHVADFTVGASNFLPIDARVNGATDWGVEVEMAGNGKKMTATLLHGSPYIYFTYTDSEPKISFEGMPVVFEGGADTQALGVTVNGRNYAFFAPSGATWSGIATTTFHCNLPSGKDYFTVAVLPDNHRDTFNFFKERAYAFVTDTRVSWDYDPSGSTVTTTFTYTTVPKEGTNRETIMALYPHQWRFNTQISPLSYTYSGIRGTMKVIAGTSFQVTDTYHGILPWFPDAGDYDGATLYDLVNHVYNEGPQWGSAPDYGGEYDTYWGGKYIGKLANILPIAEQVDHVAARDQSKGILKGMIENWLSADEGENHNLFYHDKNWGTLIGYNAGYGSDDQLNDHHFHYGYWVYGAAQLALRDKNWATQSNWGPMVEKLIHDYANPDRTGAFAPFLRNFDPYGGHSWAAGPAKFFHGNNQESSSEAMNAYAAMILWGEATGNKGIRDLGIYLYTTEAGAIQNYWYDIYNDLFDPEYPSVDAAMVWGAKIVHSTWWTDDPIQVHGINCLPITAHSLYLGYDADYPAINYDAMMDEYALRNSSPQVWKDIMAMWLAYSDPQRALEEWNTSISPEAGESVAHTYHYIHNLNVLGHVDTGVTADTPLYAVFKKNGFRTYVVYNASDSLITVGFSDGHEMVVAPNGMGVETDSQAPPAAPILTRATAGDAQVELAWSSVANASGYTVKYGTSSGSYSTDIDAGMATAYTLTGLTNDVTVYFSVCAYNAAGESPDSNELSATPGDEPPPEPPPIPPTEFTHAVTETTGSEVRLQFQSNFGSLWVDVHYKVNNGSQLNYRMTYNSSLDRWGQDVAGLNGNDLIDYWFTYEKSGLAQDTGWYDYTFGGGGTPPPPEPPPTPPAEFTQEVVETTDSQAQFRFRSNIGSQWVDVHYKVNNGSQLNYRMTNNSSQDRWEHDANGLNGNDVIEYGFTYEKTGLAKDTVWFNYTFGGGGPPPPPEPPPAPEPTDDYLTDVDRESAAQATIWFEPLKRTTWVDVHYKVNSGGQINVRMILNPSSNRYEHTAGGLIPGDAIDYWFTYDADGLAYNGDWHRYTQW